jgi:hypothetical protein
VKRLVGLAQLELEQLEELRALLNSHGIGFSETPPTLLSSGAIWVEEEDFLRARELLRQESAAVSARARAQWDQEWREVHKGSHGRWFLARLLHHPAEFLLALALLIFFVGLLVFYPLYYLARGLG